MLSKILHKIPAGTMIIPMFLSAIINTFFPEVFQIGDFTRAIFTSKGSTTVMSLALVFIGAQLRIKEIAEVAKRGGIIVFAKWLVGAILVTIIGKIFGPKGIFGISTLAFACALINANGALYLGLNIEYGDKLDQSSMSMSSLSSGAFLSLVTLGASGQAHVPILSLVDVVFPMLFGMILSNLDEKIGDALIKGIPITQPFVGITMGGSINILNIIDGGFSGILLGLLTVFITGPFALIFDIKLNKRPGYAAWAMASTAANAIAVPAAIAIVDPVWQPFVSVATTQVAAATVTTAIIVPLVTSFWAKKYGCPAYPLENQDFLREDWWNKYKPIA